jgi:hypothetical protein
MRAKILFLVGSVLLHCGIAFGQTPPAISGQPASTIALLSNSVTLKVTATGSTPLAYQWFFNNAAIPGATANQLTFSKVQFANEGAYTVRVTNQYGQALSAPAVLTVHEKARIVTAPASQTNAVGNNVTFQVVVQGVPTPTCQWQWEGHDIPGWYETYLPITNAPKAHMGKFRVKVQNQHGKEDSPEFMLVLYDKPALVAQPVNAYAVAYSPENRGPDTKAQFQVGVTGDFLSFQWYRNGEPVNPTNGSASTATLMIDRVRLEDAGFYTVEVWNDFGRVTSEPAELGVLGITAQPQSQTLNPGETISLSVAATGPDLQYQWTCNGEVIAGANQSTLTVTNVGPQDSGNFAVNVYNSWNVVASASARVKVLAPAAAFADAFAQAGAISGLHGKVRGNNTSATAEVGEPKHAGAGPFNSLWINWTAPSNGIALFHTRGSEFDTVLAVYTGSTVASLTEVASDDEFGGFHTSYVLFNMQAEIQYRIAMASLSTNQTGDLVLNWDTLSTAYALPTFRGHSPDLTVTPGAPACLWVDYSLTSPVDVQWFLGGQPIPGANGPQLQVSSVTAEHLGQYTLLFSCPDWTYVTEPIEIEFNTEGATETAARNRLAKAKASALRGIPGSSSSGGSSGNSSGGLNYSLPTFRGYSGAQTFNNYPGKDVDEPNACGVVGGASYWFCYVPPEDGLCSMTTAGSTFDTLLGVYVDDGRNLGYASLVQVACNNNSSNSLTSAVLFNVKGGTNYFIMVDGVNGAVGTVNLNYSLNALPKISSIANQTIDEDKTTAAIPFTIIDRETAGASLTLSGRSSNQSLVVDTNIVFGGSGTNRTVTVKPTLYKFGTNTITLTVTDAGGASRSTTFTLNVRDVKHAPKPTSDSYVRLPNQAINIAKAAIVRNDFDPDGDLFLISAVATTSKNRGKVTLGSTFVTYTPPVNNNAADSFTYTVRDTTGLTATSTIYINVSSTNGVTTVY